jgi:hypothetical protein
MTSPTNSNFLPTVGFKFGIKKLPTTNYFVQSINVPGLKLGFVERPNPFLKYPIPGDHLQFNDFTLTFKVDEDMKNYLEIYDWMIGLGFPDNFDQYRLIDSKSATSGEGKISDGTIQILNSARVPGIEVTVIDMFPSSLSDIIFDSRDTNLEYAQATVIFKYRKLRIQQL